MNNASTEEEAQQKLARAKAYVNSDGEHPYTNSFYVVDPGVDVKYLIVEGTPPNNTIRIDQEQIDSNNMVKTITDIDNELEKRLSKYKSPQGRLNDLNVSVDLLIKRANNGGALTSEQQPIADKLAASADWIVRTMNAAAALKADPPTNFKDNELWPSPIS